MEEAEGWRGGSREPEAAVNGQGEGRGIAAGARPWRGGGQEAQGRDATDGAGWAWKVVGTNGWLETEKHGTDVETGGR